MDPIYHTRRYLAAFDSRSVPQMFTDCLVIGSGIAGLRAAIEAGKFGRVVMATKLGVYESNTAHAQGGVAVVLRADEDDDLELHMADTVKVGCGLNDLEAVQLVVSQGPARVNELIDWGAQFDSDGGELELGLEAGHSASRVLHAKGDATGREVVRVLLDRVKRYKNIRIMENCFVIDLLTDDAKNRCLGVLTYCDGIGLQIIWSKQTILAAGGCGRVYQETTNPQTATGDGAAIAWRAGAVLQDMEMMQFHPTTLYVAGASRALITEALRGEGGYLVDRNGGRFMKEYHEDAELAPRDVVSRAIISHMEKTSSRHVFLDARHLGAEFLSKRFPHITELCESFGIGISRDLIPVRPSAHYMIGGVKTDLQGRTNVDCLLACGEAACSGLHGANRLASNSLLEGLALGYITGRTAGQRIADHSEPMHSFSIDSPYAAGSDLGQLDLQDIRNSLRSMLWRRVGIVRSAEAMGETIEAIGSWGRYTLDKTFDRPYGWEVQNLLTTACLIANAANDREESRGVHFRSDFPDRDDKNWLRHSLVCRILPK